jgi:spore germination cell wall hydrolase CwlJ-like protein
MRRTCGSRNPNSLAGSRTEATLTFHGRTTRWSQGVALVALGLAGSLVACGPPPGDPLASPPPSEDYECLALTLHWEARGEGREGMLAVGWVVLNRRADSRFPSTACAVVREGGERPGCQFSYWCDGKGDVPPPGAPWDRAQAVAAELLMAPPHDPTDGALFYHSTSVSVPWTVVRERTVQIGRHIFYR